MVLTSVTPEAVVENTSKSRVPAVTGMERPLVSPLDRLPMEITPVRAGASVTIAPAIGEKILFGVVDW